MALSCAMRVATAEIIGEVGTVSGRTKVVVGVFDDPNVPGVSRHFSCIWSIQIVLTMAAKVLRYRHPCLCNSVDPGKIKKRFIRISPLSTR